MVQIKSVRQSVDAPYEPIAGGAGQGVGRHFGLQQAKAAQDKQDLQSLIPVLAQMRMLAPAKAGDEGAINVGGQFVKIVPSTPTALDQAKTDYYKGRNDPVMIRAEYMNDWEKLHSYDPEGPEKDAAREAYRAQLDSYWPSQTQTEPPPIKPPPGGGDSETPGWLKTVMSPITNDKGDMNFLKLAPAIMALLASKGAVGKAVKAIPGTLGGSLGPVSSAYYASLIKNQMDKMGIDARNKQISEQGAPSDPSAALLGLGASLPPLGTYLQPQGTTSPEYQANASKVTGMVFPPLGLYNSIKGIKWPTSMKFIKR